MSSTEIEAARRILDHPLVHRGRRLVDDLDGETLDLQVELTEIPAPPFGEEVRAARMATHFESAGLRHVRIDAVGNVLGELPPFTGEGPGGRSAAVGDGAAVGDRAGGADEHAGPVLVVSAHLDTIFPEGTDVTVRRKDGRLLGPGISDDGRGLAALVTLARVLTSLKTPLLSGVRFVATVGEEGAGDLRGVRHLFSSEGRGCDVAGFVSLDGAGLGRIVTRGLGVRRLRLTVNGPGGHSWVNRRTPNPIHALARAVTGMADTDLRGNPPVGLTVSRWGGGTSINAVPGEAWVELDLRSESGNHLRDLEDRVRRLASAAVAAANARKRDGSVSLSVEVIGDRPAGATDPDSALVQAAVDATRVVGQEPELVASSTDSNIPMSMGIPAITMGAGGEAGNAHTIDEWFGNRNGPEGVFRAFLTVLLAAGLPDGAPGLGDAASS